MDVFYFKVDGGNFGDDMNSWFWDVLFPDLRTLSPETTILGIGSILWQGNFQRFPKILVLGSGMRYGSSSSLPEHVDIGWVRGPRTGKVLQLPADKVITDAACMLSTLPEFSGVAATGETLLIPHVGTTKLGLDWAKVAADAGATYLSPAGESKEVIRRIAGAKLVLTESLHGAIVADAFRVPWIPVSISPTFTPYKWYDWTDSMELDEVAFAPSLRLMKGLYGVRNRLKGSGKAGGAGGAAVVDHEVSGDDKAAAKRVFARFAGPIGWMLSAELRSALKRAPRLSKDAVLRDRQDRITARIAEIGDRYAGRGE